MQTGRDFLYRKEESKSSSGAQGFRNKYYTARSTRPSDHRALFSDDDGMRVLEERYATEFQAAEEYLKNKGVIERVIKPVLPHFGPSRAEKGQFEQWKALDQRRSEAYGLHRIDHCLSSPWIGIPAILRALLPLSAFVGVGQCIHFYRSVDRRALNDKKIRLSWCLVDIFLRTFCVGGLLSLTMFGGAVATDAFAALATVWWFDRVQREDRTWKRVAAASFGGCAMSGLFLSLFYRKTFTLRAHLRVLLSSVLAGAVGAWHYGYCEYRTQKSSRPRPLEKNWYTTDWYDLYAIPPILGSRYSLEEPK
jgi:hypothetical protein